MLTIWGRRTSLNVQVVMWLVAELGLAHRRIDVGGAFGGLNTPAFLPVLQDGELILWESHSILRYLAARYGGDDWFAPDPGRRALIERWMDWRLAQWEPAFGAGVFVGSFRTPPAQRDLPRIDKAVARSGQLMGLIDQALDGRGYLAGEDLSLADIAVGAPLYRYFTLDIERPPLPRLQAWYERLQMRDAYREHVMVPYESLRAV
jgi:glutathione S-transferase